MIAALVLSACGGKGPEETWQYAAQGLLSGDISRDASVALVGSIHHGGSLWEVPAGERRFNWNNGEGQFSSLRTVGVSGNGKVGATVEEDTIAVWDAVTGENRGFWKAPERVLAMRLDDEGRHALLGLRAGGAVWFDLTSGVILQEFPHTSEVRSVDLASDARLAITGSDDFSAVIWNLDSGQPVQRMQHEYMVRQVAINAQGTRVFTASPRIKGTLRDVNSGEPVATVPFHYENYTTSRFSDDGSRLLLGTFQGEIYLVDTATGEGLMQWQAKPRQAYGAASSQAVLSVAFSPGNRVMALMSDGMMESFAP